MQRANSLEKTMMLGKTKGIRRREQQRMSLLNSITNSRDMNLSKCLEIVENREVCRTQPMGFKELDMIESLNNNKNSQQSALLTPGLYIHRNGRPTVIDLAKWDRG